MQFRQLERRELLPLLAGAAAWPLGSRAQQLPLIGFLYPTAAALGLRVPTSVLLRADEVIE